MKKKKNWFKLNIKVQRESAFIWFGLIAIMVISMLGFNILWTYFKLGFFWIFSLLAMLITRKTDAWKMGVECFYFLTFVYAYVFGPIFTVPLYVICMVIVIKLRPDEFNGGIVHTIVLTGLTFTTAYLAGIYGLGISAQQFLLLGIGSILFWDTVRMFLAKKLAPVSWVKLIVSEFVGMFVNYFYFTTFGFDFFLYMQALA